MKLVEQQLMENGRNIAAKQQIHSTAGLIIYAIANKLANLGDIMDE